jgi:hypothetical protein
MPCCKWWPHSVPRIYDGVYVGIEEAPSPLSSARLSLDAVRARLHLPFGGRIC